MMKPLRLSPTVQLVTGQPVIAFRDSGLKLGGQTFPYMTQDYIGALNLYAAVPFVALAWPYANRVTVDVGANRCGYAAAHLRSGQATDPHGVGGTAGGVVAGS